MLIEFSVSNFRSFREKQTFSMVASSSAGGHDNLFPSNALSEDFPSILKVAAIYGPNASGKTNLLRALNITRSIISIQKLADSPELPVEPFRFDAELKNKPSVFEFHFVINGIRHEFYLAATKERIMEESLFFCDNGTSKLLYSRIFRDHKDEYTYGDSLKGGVKIHKFWSEITAPRVLFLAQSVANSAENFQQLRAPFEWLNRNITMFSHKKINPWMDAAGVLARKFPEGAEELSLFLSDLDVPVTTINFKQDGSTGDSEETAALLQALASEKNVRNSMILTHKTALGDAKFSFQEESDGTKNLVGFWFAWFLYKKLYPDTQGVLLVDELDSSLHPQIVTKIVSDHIQSPQRRQLIFTTHNTHLMSTDQMRRDQFWIIEKDKNGATQIRSIDDFEGDEKERLEDRYFEGRYRGLPSVKED